MNKENLDHEKIRRQLLGEEPIDNCLDEQEEQVDDEQPDYYTENCSSIQSAQEYLDKDVLISEDDYEDDNDGYSRINVYTKIALAVIIIIIIIMFVGCNQGWFSVPSFLLGNGTEPETPTETEIWETETAELEATEDFEAETEASAVSEAESIEASSENATQDEKGSELENATEKPSKQPSTGTTSTQKPIKVTATIKNIASVYGDEFKALEYEITSGNVAKSELSKYITLTKQEGNNVGQYWITGTCSAPNLFDVTFVSGVYTITLRPVTLQAENKESCVGEKLKPLTYTTEKGSIINGDKVVFLSTKADSSKAGTYDIVGKCINSNYNLTIKAGKYTVKVKDGSSSGSETETKPIDVTVKISDKSSYYGDNIVELDFSITKGNVKKSDLSKYITLTKATGNSVGSYKITGKCTNTKKYNVTFTGGTYTIKARKLSISVDNKESFVGDTLVTLTYSVTSGSVLAGDQVIELSSTADPAKAGTYDIIAKNKNSNYDVTIANKGVYTVKEKPAQAVTIQIENKASIYGDSIVELDFSIASGNVTKAEIAPYITLSREGDNNVGSHKITGSCSDTKKYNVTFIEGTYTITQRSLSVKVDSKQTYENDPLADLTYTVTGGSIVNGDKVISLSTMANPSAVGEYPIVVNCLNSNYAIQSEGGAMYRVKAKPHIPEDKEEVVENPSPDLQDKEDDIVPVKPTPSTPSGPVDEGEGVIPNTPTL